MSEPTAVLENELDALSPSYDQVTLSNGTEVAILDLKTRGFFKLLKILTRGAGSQLSAFNLSSTDSQSEFIEKLVALLIFAIPESEDETVEFLMAMVEPVGLVKGRRLSDVDKSYNQGLYEALYDYLYDPELEDLLTLVEAIIRRESADIASLGKRLQAMFKVAEKTGQLDNKSA